MGIPFEALLPYGIMVGMFGVSAAGLGGLKYIQNEWKPPRWNLDTWDRQMMQRDKRLTGTMRGQTDGVVAPPGFEVNNPWRLESRIV